MSLKDQSYGALFKDESSDNQKRIFERLWGELNEVSQLESFEFIYNGLKRHNSEINDNWIQYIKPCILQQLIVIHTGIYTYYDDDEKEMKIFDSDSHHTLRIGWQVEIVYATYPDNSNPKLIGNGFAGIIEEVKKMEIHRQLAMKNKEDNQEDNQEDDHD